MWPPNHHTSNWLHTTLSFSWSLSGNCNSAQLQWTLWSFKYICIYIFFFTHTSADVLPRLEERQAHSVCSAKKKKKSSTSLTFMRQTSSSNRMHMLIWSISYYISDVTKNPLLAKNYFKYQGTKLRFEFESVFPSKSNKFKWKAHF